jgi:hypothetical protein
MVLAVKKVVIPYWMGTTMTGFTRYSVHDFLKGENRYHNKTEMLVLLFRLALPDRPHYSTVMGLRFKLLSCQMD